MTTISVLLSSYVLISSVFSGGVSGASLSPVAGTGFSYEPTSGKPLPVWSGGALLRLDSYLSPSPVISVLDTHGAQIGSALISVPGANTVGIRCVARGGDGTIVAAGWTSASDGRTTEILALISADGGTIGISRISPFSAKQLAVAPDGTIWVQGFMGRNPDQIPDADPSHGIIRHFDRTGKMIASFMPEAQLDDRRRGMMGYLAVSADRVGWISWVPGSGGTIVSGGYVEISGDGSLRQYPLPRMAIVKGFAITSGDVPVAGVVAARAKAGRPEQSAIMMFDRQHAVWTVLSVPGVPSMAGKQLLGGTGNMLAVLDFASRLVSFFTAN